MDTRDSNCPFCETKLALKQELLFCSGCNYFIGHPETFKENLKTQVRLSSESNPNLIYREHTRRRNSRTFAFLASLIAVLIIIVLFFSI